MTEQRLYRLACHVARELLARLDRGDYDGVNEKLRTIRHYLTLVGIAAPGPLRGEALHRREQMELLAGVVERLAESLAAVRARLAGEMETLGADRALLRHLVTQSTPGLRSRAAGCT
jgi:hypothetical protein